MKKKKPKMGRPKIGQPISITLTDEQREFVDSLIPPGGTRTQVIRALIQTLLETQKGKKGG